MLISLIVGVLLGAVSVVFVLQNVAMVTVAFFSWQLTGSLALVLLATLVVGIIIALLLLLPSVIKDSFFVSSLKTRIKELENENASLKQPQTVVVQASPVV